MKRWKLATFVGIGIGLAVAGMLLYKKHKNKDAEFCGDAECDATADCIICGYTPEGKDNVKGRNNRKKG